MTRIVRFLRRNGFRAQSWSHLQIRGGEKKNIARGLKEYTHTHANVCIRYLYSYIPVYTGIPVSTCMYLVSTSRYIYFLFYLYVYIFIYMFSPCELLRNLLFHLFYCNHFPLLLLLFLTIIFNSILTHEVVQSLKPPRNVGHFRLHNFSLPSTQDLISRW